MNTWIFLNQLLEKGQIFSWVSHCGWSEKLSGNCLWQGRLVQFVPSICFLFYLFRQGEELQEFLEEDEINLAQKPTLQLPTSTWKGTKILSKKALVHTGCPGGKKTRDAGNGTSARGLLVTELRVNGERARNERSEGHGERQQQSAALLSIKSVLLRRGNRNIRGKISGIDLSTN